MPRGRLTEAYVQEAAVAWLESHYRDMMDPSAIEKATQMGVAQTSPYGRGRADGLVAMLLRDGRVYTASVEAKWCGLARAMSGCSRMAVL